MRLLIQRMGNLGGLVVAVVLVLAGCASPLEFASNVQPATSVKDEMLDELRPHLKTLDASDEDLVDEARDACGKLSRRGRDEFRESLLKKYDEDLTRALDHLTVAAAGKKYLCP